MATEAARDQEQSAAVASGMESLSDGHTENVVQQPTATAGDVVAAVWAMSRSTAPVGGDRDPSDEDVRPVWSERPSGNAEISTQAQDWRTLVSQYAWDTDTVLRIIHGPYPRPNGESGGNPTAISPDGANWGLMQINYASHTDKLYAVTGSYDPYLLYDPAVNIAVGYRVYVANSGFSPWSCY